jgi:YD repeat-containing protein
VQHFVTTSFAKQGVFLGMNKTRMKFLFTLFSLPLALGASAQYYYKDIVGNRESNEQLGHYRSAGVRSVTLASYDADGSRSDALEVQQRFDNGKLTTTTVLDSNSAVLLSFVDDQGRVARTVDSSEASLSTTTYTYNTQGQLERVANVTRDIAGRFVQEEVHRWEWSNGRPQRMWRIKNGRDSVEVRLVIDERGNVSEEHTQQRGQEPDVVYYYYDGKGQLTDIVRFNQKAKRLLPEYMFEYNDAGQVIQRITVPANNSNYTIWRYQYDERGLKIKEALYDRYKKMSGKVEYTYNTGS